MFFFLFFFLPAAPPLLSFLSARPFCFPTSRKEGSRSGTVDRKGGGERRIPFSLSPSQPFDPLQKKKSTSTLAKKSKTPPNLSPGPQHLRLPASSPRRAHRSHRRRGDGFPVLRSAVARRAALPGTRVHCLLDRQLPQDDPERRE